METIYIDSIDDLKEVYAGIAEDWNQIDYADWLGKELDLLSEVHKRYFDASAGPDGNAWAANAPRTVREKGHATVLRGVRGRADRNVRGTKNRPRVRFVRSRWIRGFRLSTSLTAKTRQTFGDAIREAIATDDGGYLKFGTAVEYAGYNDQGTSRIPARPHIGINEQHLTGMTERAADYTLAQLAK